MINFIKTNRNIFKIVDFSHRGSWGGLRDPDGNAETVRTVRAEVDGG